jgi:hypothetical protein
MNADHCHVGCGNLATTTYCSRRILLSFSNALAEADREEDVSIEAATAIQTRSTSSVPRVDSKSNELDLGPQEVT